MGFPLATILKWVLPAIPELISTVRSMKTQQQAPAGSFQNDPQGRIERLEKALELQSRINEELTTQLHQLRKRLQITTFMAILGLILGVLALALNVFR